VEAVKALSAVAKSLYSDQGLNPDAAAHVREGILLPLLDAMGDYSTDNRCDTCLNAAFFLSPGPKLTNPICLSDTHDLRVGVLISPLLSLILCQPPLAPGVLLQMVKAAGMACLRGCLLLLVELGLQTP
jgi:hypothetical protein